MDSEIPKGRNRHPVNALDAKDRRGGTRPVTHPVIKLGGVPQLPEACVTTLQKSNGDLTAEQLAQCDEAIAAAMEEMTRRRVNRLRSKSNPAA